MPDTDTGHRGTHNIRTAVADTDAAGAAEALVLNLLENETLNEKERERIRNLLRKEDRS